MTEKKCSLYAKHEPIHCLTPYLFTSLRKGDRKRLKLDVKWEFGKKRKIEWAGPEPLGPNDLRTLQGLISLIRNDWKILDSRPETKIGEILRDKLELKYDALQSKAIVIETTYGQLMKTVGYSDNTKNTNRVRECIERLWKVTAILQIGTKRLGFHLLSYYASENNQRGKLYFALNPLLAKIALGKEQYIFIDMNEVRAIKLDSTRLLHQRLCAIINPGKNLKIGIEKLCEYVYNKTENRKTQRSQHQSIRKALDELKNLSWKVEEYAENSFRITRPPRSLK